MADVNNTDVRTATNASNTTRYFHLPLFIASDKPSWLVDWNGAMGDIDNILQDIATASEGAVADVATIQSQIDALNATIPNLQSLVETAVSDVAAMQTTVSSHETRMDNIEQDLITQNNLIKTLSDAVTTMQATVATLNNRVQAMETTVSGLDTNVSAITTELSNIRTQISGLDTRVRALEQAQPSGGGGMPFFNDLNFIDELVPYTGSSSHDMFTLPTDAYVYLSIAYGVRPRTGAIPYNIECGAGTIVTGNYQSNMIADSQHIPQISYQSTINITGNLTSGLYKLANGTQIEFAFSEEVNDSNEYCDFYVHYAPLDPNWTPNT